MKRQAAHPPKLQALEEARAAAEQMGYVSLASIRMTTGDVILAASKQEGFFDERKLRLYQALAEQGAQALQSARLQAAVRESQERLSLLVRQSPLAVIEWNTDFEVAAWNPAAEEIFGYSQEEAMGRHAAGLIVPEHVRELVDQVWQDLLTQTGGTRSTNENITKDGRVITCEWYNTPLVGPDGQTLGVASLAQDITGRIQAEEDLRHHVERLRTLRRIDQAGETANHEIATEFDIAVGLVADPRADNQVVGHE